MSVSLTYVPYVHRSGGEIVTVDCGVRGKRDGEMCYGEVLYTHVEFGEKVLVSGYYCEGHYMVGSYMEETSVRYKEHTGGEKKGGNAKR